MEQQQWYKNVVNIFLPCHPILQNYGVARLLYEFALITNFSNDL